MVSERRIAKKQEVTVKELQSMVPELTEEQIMVSLDLLASDQSELVCKVGFDQQLQQGRYAIDWQAAFKQVQLTLIDEIISGSFGQGQGGPHFCRVIRILRQRGFMEEKELVKLSLLPQKNVLAIVNRFIADGLVTTQEMPIKGGSSVGHSGGLLLYGVSQSHIVKKIGYSVAKSILNVSLATGGKLGKLSNLTLELNHLLIV